MTRANRSKLVLSSWVQLLALAAIGGIGALNWRQPAVAAETGDQPTTQPSVDFTKDIQPIFQESCIKCHQLHPTNGSRGPSSNFRLDDKTAAMKGGRKGHDIVPGDSAKSALYNVLKGRYNGIDPMPDAGRGQTFKPLPDEKIALIKAWIDQGATWPATSTTAPSAPPAAP